jgi:hypothetical protein
MKRALVGALATVALGLGLGAPAAAATPNDHASCAGIVPATFAGDPGRQAARALDFVGQGKQFGVPPGRVLFSDVAHQHPADTGGSCFDT